MSVVGGGSCIGPFVVEDVLGRGGMGVVYRARQERLERTVALKVIAASDPMAQRFAREAVAAARLEHPHVVPVYETGETAVFCSLRCV